MFESMELTELNDSQLQDILDASGKGKPPVYRKPLRELLDAVGDRQGSVSVPWLEINPAADKRATVIMGLRNAIKKDENAKDRVTVRTNTDDSKVTFIVRKSA